MMTMTMKIKIDKIIFIFLSEYVREEFECFHWLSFIDIVVQ